MTRFPARLVASIVVLGSALLAQDITGTWQGALQIPGGRELRTVVKVSKTDAGGLGATFYSIDQSGQGVPVNPITVQGSVVRMSIPAIGGSYEGKLEADGNSITGTFKQGPGSLALNLKKATPQTAWEIPEPPPPPKPMAADVTPEFEVATIKPSTPDRPGKAITVQGRQVITFNTTLGDLVTFAYGIHLKQVVGAPAWFESEKYDITAQPPGEGQPSDKQLRTMLQRLLADRFSLAFHREKRELSVYAITPGKGSAKLTKSAGNAAGLPGLFFRALGNLTATNANMNDFAQLLQSAVLDRPVIDQTGLDGRWDFTLLWTPDEFQFAGFGGAPRPAANDPAAPPDLFTAMQEQLGLKLETTRAPAEVIVIDKVAKPSEN